MRLPTIFIESVICESEGIRQPLMIIYHIHLENKVNYNYSICYNIFDNLVDFQKISYGYLTDEIVLDILIWYLLFWFLPWSLRWWIWSILSGIKYDIS
jgi:hypothetical protein